MKTTTDHTFTSKKRGGAPETEKNVNEDDNVKSPYPSFSDGGIVPTNNQTFADGGFVNYDPKMLGDLTPGTSDQNAPPPSPQPMPAPPAAVAPTAIPRGTPPAAPAMKLPGMPNVNPADLEAYFNAKKQAVGNYGPDQQVALQQKLMADRNSLGSRVGNAATGFADALMQGVAEAGNPGFNAAFTERQNRAEDQTLGMMKSAHEQSLADMKEKMAIDAEDPASPLSKAAQKAYGDTLIASGVPPAAVKGMSASLISDVAAKRVTLADAMAKLQLENTWKGAEIGVQKEGMAQKAKEQKMKGLEESTKLGPIDRFMHPDAAKAIDAEAGIGKGATSGMTRIRDSSGQLHDLPSGNLAAAKKRDPGLQVIQ